MILANGTVYDTARQGDILGVLEDQINATLASRRLEAETVVAAIHTLGERLAAGAFAPLLARLELDGTERYMEQLIPMLRREALEYKLQVELGRDAASYSTKPPGKLPPLTVQPAPLGVLLHIAAGNVDGLPAYSVAEGLLTGNINILKLPQADNGLSIEILRQLIAVEPALTDFIYVFDTPSTDLPALQQMAALSDGIVVWGGDGAVSAVRRFAPPGVKLMEWGHKLSFAYLSGKQDREGDWTALAKHIMSTKQLLCSSCQTIFLDTDSIDDVHTFCRDFLPYLERAAAKYPGRGGGAHPPPICGSGRAGHLRPKLREWPCDLPWGGLLRHRLPRPGIRAVRPVRSPYGEGPAPGPSSACPAAAQGPFADRGPAVPGRAAGRTR